MINHYNPLTLMDIQNSIHEFNNINVCQGILKNNTKSLRINVVEANGRRWHPKCLHTLVNKNRYIGINITVNIYKLVVIYILAFYATSVKG